MRKLVLLLFGRFVNRIGRFVFPRRLPVPLEHARQILHDGGITHLYGDFPSQIECWLVKVLRTEKRPLIVDDEKFALDLLVSEKILVTQGTGFNWPAPDHLRIVTLPCASDLSSAIDRLADFLDGYRH